MRLHEVTETVGCPRTKATDCSCDSLRQLSEAEQTIEAVAVLGHGDAKGMISFKQAPGKATIISGTITLNVQLSRGDAKKFKLLDYVTGNAKYGRIGIKISDVKTGKLLWKYEKQIDRKTGKNTVDLIGSMMRQASRKFPYEK